MIDLDDSSKTSKEEEVVELKGEEEEEVVEVTETNGKKVYLILSFLEF